MRILISFRDDDDEEFSITKVPMPLQQYYYSSLINEGAWHKNNNHMDLSWLVPKNNNAKERKLVCVTSGNSFLGTHIVKELLGRGYLVRLTVQTQQDIINEEVRSEGDQEEEEVEMNMMRMVESVVIANMGDMGSLCEAFEGCDAVFHTSSFIDLKGVSGYSEQKALLEAKGAENVIEASGRVGSVKRCIFASSLLASVWQRSGISGVLDESCWTDEEFCRENKLWLALGKTMAEKAAWRKSQETNVKMVSVCHGLLTSPTFPSAHDSSAIPYLKGGRMMLLRGVLATAAVKKVAEAHVSIFEAMDQGACGRYLCFDRVLRDEDEAIQLEHRLKMHGQLSRQRNVLQGEEVAAERGCILSNAKLANLISYASPRSTCNS